MDFTTLPIGTPVIWDRSDAPINGVIERIVNDWQPILVRFNDFTLWFTADGRHSPGALEPTLRLVDPVVEKEGASLDQGLTSSLQDVWVQFMCAALIKEESTAMAAVTADAALEKYKSRFQWNQKLS